jgi:hypothetical protein
LEIPTANPPVNRGVGLLIERRDDLRRRALRDAVLPMISASVAETPLKVTMISAPASLS